MMYVDQFYRACCSLRCLQKIGLLSELVARVQHRCLKLVDQLYQLVLRDPVALVPSRGMFLMYYLMNQIFQKVSWR